MKSRWVYYFGFITLVVSHHCTADDFPIEQWNAWRQHTTDRWPQETWLQYATQEEAGWSSEKLQQAREYYDTIDSAAVMVVYDGAVLAAWGEVDRRFPCHSIRKSLLSALYGIHVADGDIDLTKTIAELEIDDKPPLTDAEKEARVGDLLKSRSGVFHPAAYETAKMKKNRPPRGSHKPREVFWYNNWDFNTLCTIFEQETGTKVFEDFQKRFAVPLGMEDFRLQDTYYHLEEEHSIHPAYPFRLSARDMSRFGLLFLRRGKWQDRQILTDRWVRESTASHFQQGDTTSNSQYAYGYLWWRIVDGPFKDLGMYSARGYGGHAIDVLPVADLVLVHRVNTFWDVCSRFVSEKHRVKDSERFKLLDMILRARVSQPKADPKMVPFECSREKSDAIQIDPSILDRYTREYDFGEFKLCVKRSGDCLLIGSPGMGDFSLLPLSDTKFLMEDVRLPVAFRFDDNGNPARMTIEPSMEERFEGRPVMP